MKKRKLFWIGAGLAAALCLLGCPSGLEPGSASPMVTSVTVNPSTASVAVGRTQQFIAVVNGINSPSQTVLWSVSGNLALTTNISNGLLTVAASETATSLMITATSTADASKSGIAAVTVTGGGQTVTVTSVSVSPSSATVNKGGEQQFAATVTGTNNPAQTVTWSVFGGNTGTSINSTSGLLTVATGEMASTLTVTATSTVNTSVSGTATVTVSGQIATVTGVTVSPNSAVVKGETKQFTATVTGTNNPAQTVTWSVSGGGTGTSINSTSGLLTVAASEMATALTVTATSAVNTSQSGSVSVSVVNAGQGPTVTSVSVSPSQVTVNKGGGQPFTATVTGTNNPSTNVNWTVTGNTKQGTSISTDGFLTIAADEMASTLTVTATSTEDSTKSVTATVTVTGGGGGTSTPGTPTNVTATAQSSSSILITWDAPSSGGMPANYNIVRSSSASGPYTSAGSVNSSTTSYTDTGLSSSTMYYYKVEAENYIGYAMSSYAYATTMSSGGGGTTIPGIPMNVTAEAQSSSSILIWWDTPSSGATPAYYNIWRSSSASGTYTKISYVSGFTTSYTNSGLSESTTYYYKVEAETSGNIRGEKSSYAYATTWPSGVTTGIPTNVTATALSSSSIRISWDPPSSGATPAYYDIWRSSSPSGGSITDHFMIYATSYTDTGLSASTMYYYKVSANSGAAMSGPVAYTSAKTPAY